MTKSESIQNLAKALCQFQGLVKPIDLNKRVKVTMKTGGVYFFEYATFDNILNNIRPHLVNCGLSFTQLLGKAGEVTTVIMHESGEFISTTTEVTSNGSIQDIGGNYSYIKRYALCAAFGIVGEEDDDGNGTSGNSVEVQKEVLTDQHPKWQEVVKFLANDGSWKQVEQRFVITQDVKNDLEADIALFNDPTAHGHSASAKQIGKKVEKIAG